MIELELKYKIDKKPNINIEGQTSDVEDIYYDTTDYTLLKNGNFLRLRNKKSIDFKLSANDLTHLYCSETNYSVSNFDSENINKVLKNIGVELGVKSSDELFNSLDVLAKVKKHRTSYNIEENVVMVIDEVEDLGIFLEIEYDIEKDSITKEESDKYKEYLIRILKDNNYITDTDEQINIGYVELYLKKYNLDAYNLGLYK